MSTGMYARDELRGAFSQKTHGKYHVYLNMLEVSIPSELRGAFSQKDDFEPISDSEESESQSPLNYGVLSHDKELGRILGVSESVVSIPSELRGAFSQLIPGRRWHAGQKACLNPL